MHTGTQQHSVQNAYVSVMQGDISALVHNPPAFTAQTWEHIPANPLTHIPLGQAHLLSSLNLLSSSQGSNWLHEGRKIKRLLMPTAAYLILQHKTGLVLAGSLGSSMTRGVHTTGTQQQAPCFQLVRESRLSARRRSGLPGEKYQLSHAKTG